MRLIILKNQEQVGAYTANYIMQRILDFNPTQERPFVLGLPTGSSPIPTYRCLIQLYQNGSMSFQNVVTFNMDEYCELPQDHSESYYTFMWNNLFQHVDIRRENVNILNGNAPDWKVECQAYEEKIASYGGIELFIGGIGPDGHIAFNEPGSSLSSTTRMKTLAYDTIVANSRNFGGETSNVPKRALTVGVKTFLDANEVLVIITGISKALALQKSIEEGISHMWTVSAIQLHKNAMVVCDDDATSELRVKTVRYFKSLQGTCNLSQCESFETISDHVVVGD